MNAYPRLELPKSDRKALWALVSDAIEAYVEELPSRSVCPSFSVTEVRQHVQAIDFERPMLPAEVVAHVVTGLSEFSLHTGHSRSFGLFNPTPSTMGIAADALVAAFNPQLAAWSHAPFAIEIEQYVLRAFASRLGYDPASSEGTFASGGAEANHTAVLLAIERAFPSVLRAGFHTLAAKPTMYVSAESHHSFVKAARSSGLGTDAVRRVPVDGQLRMDVGALVQMMAADRAAGHSPFMVVGTLGTTSAGAIDDLEALAFVAKRESVWLHADAAYGGGAALLPELKGALGDVGCTDSVTIDAHKWLSVPMGAGMLLTRERGGLSRAFAITTEYVPVNNLDTVDPYAQSMQWSRRFIGLKLFMTLAVAGWDGYAEVIGHQDRMARLLRQRLADEGWQVVFPSHLPVVCFVDGAGADPHRVAQRVVDGGLAWLSATRVGGESVAVLRACVTSYRTTEADVEILLSELGKARAAERRA